jgi:putative transposase
MRNASYDTDLSDEQWCVLEPLLPKARKTGRPRTCLRRIINAILYVLKTGCQWACLPKDFPPKSTVHGFFRAWTRLRFIESLHARLRAQAREAEGRRCRPTSAILDSQTVRSAGLAEQVGYDGAKMTKGRKRFLLVDTLGHVLAVAVLPGNVPERAGAKELLNEVLASPTWLQRLYVDGGFSGPDFAKHVVELKPSLEVEVVKRCNATTGFKVLHKRWVVERTFGWLMQCRRLARDYERLSESVAAWIHVAMIRIMLRRLA